MNYILSDIEQYITQKGHLPNVPSAKTVSEQGLELGNITRIQQEKIEELYLYAIQQKKKMAAQEKENKRLTNKFMHQEKKLEEQENKNAKQEEKMNVLSSENQELKEKFMRLEAKVTQLIQK